MPLENGTWLVAHVQYKRAPAILRKPNINPVAAGTRSSISHDEVEGLHLVEVTTSPSDRVLSVSPQRRIEDLLLRLYRQSSGHTTVPGTGPRREDH